MKCLSKLRKETLGFHIEPFGIKRSLQLSQEHQCS